MNDTRELKNRLIKVELASEFEALRQDLIDNKELNEFCKCSEELTKSITKLKECNKSHNIHILIAYVICDIVQNNIHFKNIKRLLKSLPTISENLDQYNIYLDYYKFIFNFSTLSFFIMSIESLIYDIEHNKLSDLK